MMPDQTLPFGPGVVIRDTCWMPPRGQGVEYDSVRSRRREGISGVDVSSGRIIQIQEGSRCEAHIIASLNLLSVVVAQEVFVVSYNNSRHLVVVVVVVVVAYGINAASATLRLLSASTK